MAKISFRQERLKLEKMTPPSQKILILCSSNCLFVFRSEDTYFPSAFSHVFLVLRHDQMSIFFSFTLRARFKALTFLGSSVFTALFCKISEKISENLGIEEALNRMQLIS